jgi:hypothetical protein
MDYLLARGREATRDSVMKTVLRSCSLHENGPMGSLGCLTAEDKERKGKLEIRPSGAYGRFFALGKKPV